MNMNNILEAAYLIFNHIASTETEQRVALHNKKGDLLPLTIEPGEEIACSDLKKLDGEWFTIGAKFRVFTFTVVDTENSCDLKFSLFKVDRVNANTPSRNSLFPFTVDCYAGSIGTLVNGNCHWLPFNNGYRLKPHEINKEFHAGISELISTSLQNNPEFVQVKRNLFFQEEVLKNVQPIGPEKYLLDTLGDVMSIFDVNDDVFNNIMRTIIINYGYYETCRLLEFIFNIHSNYEFNVRKVYEVDKDYFVEEVYPFLENPGKYYIIDSIRIKATRGKDDLSRSFHVGVLKRLKNYID